MVLLEVLKKKRRKTEVDLEMNKIPPQGRTGTGSRVGVDTKT